MGDKNNSDWVVYLLKCADESLYCGITNNLEKRLRQHNGEIKGGAKYTSVRRPCRLSYCENSDSRSAAAQREYQIKKLSKSAKELLVQRFESE